MIRPREPRKTSVVSDRAPITPVILLHGFAQTSTSWNDVAQRLQDAGYHTYVPDLYGWAFREQADRKWDDVSFQGVVDHGAAIVRQVAVAQGAPVVVGYSMGGRIAAEMVVRYPDLPLAGLVLESPGLGPLDDADRHSLVQRNGAWACRLREEGVETFMDWWETLPLFASQRRLPEPTRTALRAERTSHDAEALAHSLEAWGAHHQTCESETLAALAGFSRSHHQDSADNAADSSPFVLYIAGSLDEKYRAVAERISAAELSAEVIPDAGHNVHVEQPEAFSELLERFLAVTRSFQAGI